MHASFASASAIVRLLLTTAACSGALGCASHDLDPDLAPQGDDSLAQTSPRVPMSDAGSIAPYFSSVTANGTGCPKDSWNTGLSPDGRKFTTTFSSYEASLDDRLHRSFKDCQLSVKLHSDTPLSWAVDAFHYEGNVFMEAGVRGFVTANYYFQGMPAPATDAARRTDLTGPIDRHLTFEESLPEETLVWSPCGRDRTLQIISRIGVQSPEGTGSGYIVLSNLNRRGRIEHGLRWRTCVENARDAGDAGPATLTGSLDAGLP